MAGRSGPSYQKYRGRRGGGGTVLKIIIVILAVLLVAGVLFLLLLGDYVEYTDGGVRLNLPWSGTESEAPEESAALVVVSVEPVTVSEPVTAAELTAIGAVEVTAGQVLDGTAAQIVADAGGDALVVEMKDADGLLAWQSETELAATLGVNASDDSMAQAVAALAGEDGPYLVARVQCFLDLAMVKARSQNTILLTTGGNIWYDSTGYCWSSPASEPVADYLAGLCVELAEMGFDEILLDSAGYPTQGNVKALATDELRPEDLTAPVTAFYEKVSAALEGTGTALSVQLTALPDGETGSGITAAALAQFADRVWLSAAVDAQACAALLEPEGLTEPETRLVLENETGETGSWYKAG